MHPAGRCPNNSSLFLPQAVTNANEYKIFSAKNGQSEAETIPNRPMHKRPLHKMLCNGLLL